MTLETEIINGFRFIPHEDKNGYYSLEVYLLESWTKIAYLETVPEWIPNEIETGLIKHPLYEKVWMVFVDENYRRQGIASAMYNKAEKDLAKKLVRGDVVTEDGQGFKRK